MPSKLEIKYRCSHCGKKNLYKTKRHDKKIRHCAWCNRDFEVIPVAKTLAQAPIDEGLTSSDSRHPPSTKDFEIRHPSSNAALFPPTPNENRGDNEFDPYLKWLGIRTLQRPPNHYRLLGVENFESDINVITSAADRQLTHLKSFQSGKHESECAALLKEVIVARNCLLSPKSRATYEQTLRVDLSHNAGLMADAAENFNSAFPTPPHIDSKPHSFDHQPVNSNLIGHGNSSEPQDEFKLRTKSFKKNKRYRKRKKKSALSEMMGTLLGGICAVFISYLIFRWFVDIDPEALKTYQENIRRIIE